MRYDFTGSKDTVMNKLRKEFDEFVYPFFNEIERERVGSSKDGRYTHQFIAPSGLKYTGIIELEGLSVRWYFSTKFSYDSLTEITDKGRCFAMFYVDRVCILTHHALHRYNERTLNDSYSSIDLLFHERIESLMDYSRKSKSKYKGRPNQFLCVYGGAFLSKDLHNCNNWFSTYISTKEMSPNQLSKYNRLMAISSFESSSGYALSSIVEENTSTIINEWINSDKVRMQQYKNALQACLSLYADYTEEELDEEDRRLQTFINKEISRIAD